MLIIPAIDIRGGQCVRLTQGDFDQQTVYGTDPVAMAKHWEAEGARMLHIVDLDGAKDGRAINRDVIAQIAGAISIPVEVGGGVRTAESALALLASGVSRVIVGTMAFEGPEVLRGLLKTHATGIVVALETKDGQLRTRGWQQAADGQLVAVAQELQSLGVQRFLYTDVSKDGTMTEPNYHEIKQLQGAVTVPIIASGGISNLRAIKTLRAMGVEDAIIGKALYEGKLNLQGISDAS